MCREGVCAREEGWAVSLLLQLLGGREKLISCSLSAGTEVGRGLMQLGSGAGRCGLSGPKSVRTQDIRD